MGILDRSIMDKAGFDCFVDKVVAASTINKKQFDISQGVHIYIQMRDRQFSENYVLPAQAAGQR